MLALLILVNELTPLDAPSWLTLGVPVFVIAVELLPGRSRRLPKAERAAGAGEPDAVETEPPVTGRWSALNSPADKVPSHGVRAYGQAYAIDIVAESGDPDRKRPAFGWWPPVRSNRDFPAFGAPVLAVADATVVRAVGSRRDHYSRNSWPALLPFFLEGFARDVAGPGRLFGNHLILDLGDGTYAAYAHLRKDSLAVRAGERVRAGQRLAEVGNTGNSTEPHLHFQLMDRPEPHTARGVPFRWRGVGVPANGETFTVAAAGERQGTP
ncbi:M23 family metallopeptidase [Streptomyces sp. NPDC048845]|uniref:M23 family metallopeptidase n=1 Tax=Streptomyces sp. NPDC048845 TaxID=3155390 RepID=UPI003428923B